VQNRKTKSDSRKISRYIRWIAIDVTKSVAIDRGLSRRHGARSACDRKIVITFSAWIIYSSSWSLPHVCDASADETSVLPKLYLHIHNMRSKYTSYANITCIFSDRNLSLFKNKVLTEFLTAVLFLRKLYTCQNYKIISFIRAQIKTDNQ